MYQPIQPIGQAIQQNIVQGIPIQVQKLFQDSPSTPVQQLLLQPAPSTP